MFKMIEVIGSSPSGYSMAVKEAIEQVIASGEAVHFFEVVEQRGAVRDGKFKEYQVKLKVAVESEKKVEDSNNTTAHVCQTCLQETGKEGHMCILRSDDDTECEWCGALVPDERHLCDEKVKELAYICNTCGRSAVQAKHLCNPKKI